jgi:lipoprotein-anchoring transpeptidase ErfK/SrfK
MKQVIALSMLALFACAVALLTISAAFAAGPQWIVVSPGDTLAVIAARYRTSVEALIRANNLPNPSFVYSGQRLIIPDPSVVFPAPAPETALISQPQTQPQPLTLSNVFYTVRPGDSLAAIAARYGVSAVAIAQANNLTNWNFVWYGQRLRIPGTNVVNPIPPAAQPQPNVPPPANPPPSQNPATAPAPVNAPTTGKWIDVNVGNQTISAYEGDVLQKTISVSTGVPRTPTVLGTFKVLSKYQAVHMIGGTPGFDYYDLPNVPYTMFFFRGYAIHGTYWHKNFGHPMSHGCVNLPTDEAKWFYEWAPIGTPVVVHR